jgi:hypothetical protein
MFNNTFSRFAPSNGQPAPVAVRYVSTSLPEVIDSHRPEACILTFEMSDGSRRSVPNDWLR